MERHMALQLILYHELILTACIRHVLYPVQPGSMAKDLLEGLPCAGSILINLSGTHGTCTCLIQYGLRLRCKRRQQYDS